MCKKYLKDFMEKIKFPSLAQDELLLVFDKICADKDFANCVAQFDNNQFDFINSLEVIKGLSQKYNVCDYSAYMLFLLCLTPKLHERYLCKGIDDTVFYNTLSDLLYKLEECKLVHGKCGTFVPKWYKGIFEMRIFALGRLQFEIKDTWFECEVNGTKIPKGTKVLSVHIPRTGTKLNHELVIDSYKQAAEFFKDEFDGNIIFICNSWLLYPWNRSILNDTSNLALFYDDFTIVETGEYSDYSETWRLFDCLYNDNHSNLPCDSSLRRAYIKRMNNHEPLGYATGVFIYTN